MNDGPSRLRQQRRTRLRKLPGSLPVSLRFPSLLLLIGLDLKPARQAGAIHPVLPPPVSSSVLRPPSHGRALRLVRTTSAKNPRSRRPPPLHAMGRARLPQAETGGR